MYELWRPIESKYVEMGSPSSNQSLTILFLPMDGMQLTTEHSAQIKKGLHKVISL